LKGANINRNWSNKETRNNWGDKDEYSHKSAYVSGEKLTDEGVPMAIN